MRINGRMVAHDVWLSRKSARNENIFRLNQALAVKDIEFPPYLESEGYRVSYIPARFPKRRKD